MTVGHWVVQCATVQLCKKGAIQPKFNFVS